MQLEPFPLKISLQRYCVDAREGDDISLMCVSCHSSSSLESCINDSLSSDDSYPSLINRHIDYNIGDDAASVGDASHCGSHQDGTESSEDNESVINQLDFNRRDFD